MRLLIVTQKVDIHDDLLGFFYRWIKEFAKHCESVTVICLEKGVHELPSNVRVFSLGKESGRSRVKYLKHFYSYVWSERGNYDAVFVHMNTEYLVLAGWLWRLLEKKIALWHVHFEVNTRLWIAEKFSHIIFTTTRAGCRIKSKKVLEVGHGIDTARFLCERGAEIKEPIRLLYAGKITPIKNVHILVDAARILKSSWNKEFIIDIVGPPTTPEYDNKLRKYIVEKNIADVVKMHGRVSYKDIPKYYREADAVINMCPIGGMDKTVLEGLASRTLAVVANSAFRELFGAYADELIYSYQDPEELVEKIKGVFEKENREIFRMREYLHERMKTHSSLETRIPLMTRELKSL